MQELEKDMNAVPAPESGPEIVAEGTVDSTPSVEEQFREAVLKNTKPTDHGYRQQDYDRILAIK